MDTHILTTVCDTLEAHTEQIALIIADRNAIDEKIKSGRYSAETVQKELHPKRNALEQQIKVESDRAIQAAQALVNKYRADAEALDELNPADITEAKQIADGLDSILRYYANWIGTPNAQKMLHRFFSMT